MSWGRRSHSQASPFRTTNASAVLSRSTASRVYCRTTSEERVDERGQRRGGAESGECRDGEQRQERRKHPPGPLAPHERGELAEHGESVHDGNLYPSWPGWGEGAVRIIECAPQASARGGRKHGGARSFGRGRPARPRRAGRPLPKERAPPCFRPPRALAWGAHSIIVTTLSPQPGQLRCRLRSCT